MVISKGLGKFEGWEAWHDFCGKLGRFHANIVKGRPFGVCNLCRGFRARDQREGHP
jgi:hypothetical protein